MFTNTELKTKIANLVQRAGDAAYIIKIQDWLNFAQDFAYRYYDYFCDLEDTYTFNTVSGQENYYMPALFGMPLRTYNNTSGNKLTIQTEQTYEDTSLSSIIAATKGTPEFARFYGISAIARDLTGSITLQAKSSSVSDTSVSLRIEGYVDSAKTILGYDTITLNSSSPTTYQASTSPVTFYGITKITKSGDTVGYVTIADNSSNVLATIMPVERASRYVVLKLGLIPDAVYSIKILFKRKVNRMVNDYDYPFIDADEFFVNYAYQYAMNEEKENVERVPLIQQKVMDCLNAVVRTEQTRLGEDYQHKIVFNSAQAFRV